MTTILVVDDRPTDRQLLVTLLGYMGYQVLEAGDGVEALAIARAEQPDLMIVDVLMPTLDGLELVRQLRADAATAGMRVIFCTASYLLGEVETLAAQSGVAHILSKPIEPEDALKVIAAALELPPPSVPDIQVDTFREEHLKVLANNASRLSSQLGQVAPRLAALIELGHQLASERDPFYLLQIFCHAARDIVGSKYAAVAILNDDGQGIRHFLTSGMSDDEALRIGGQPQGRGLLHRLLVENGPVRVDDIHQHPLAVGFPARHPPMHTFLGVPILSPERRYGSFYLTEKLGHGSFDEEDEQIVVTLAAQVAVAYENACRYDDLQREMAKREEAEKMLRQSEVRFRALTENSADGIALEDASGKLIYITPAFTRITGYTLDDLRGRSHRDLYHPDDLAAAEAQHAIVANVRDIAGRKEFETELERRVARRTAELQQAKEQVEAILRNSGDAIIVARIDGTIRQTNPAFNALFGYADLNTSPNSMIDLVEADEVIDLIDLIRSIAEGGQVRRFDITVRRGDGSRFNADMALSGIADEQNQIVDLVCSVRDISARKQLEIQLRQNLERERELNELKSRFIATVSHDFRTPLTVILSSTDTYRRYADRMNAEQRGQHFTRIQYGVEQITHLLDDVVNYAQAEAGQTGFHPVPIALSELCHAIAAEVQTLPGQAGRINFATSGSCNGAVVDEKLIRQMVMQLLSNALKYSLADQPVQFDLMCFDDRAVLRISDQGIGIPEKDRQHLFEPFHRAQNIGSTPGTGLGLAIVKRAVDLHGGTITFESEEHIGTTFTVMLPVRAEKREAP
jgi:PAS domain S-box-containing protein